VWIVAIVQKKFIYYTNKRRFGSNIYSGWSRFKIQNSDILNEKIKFCQYNDSWKRWFGPAQEVSCIACEYLSDKGQFRTKLLCSESFTKELHLTLEIIYLFRTLWLGNSTQVTSCKKSCLMENAREICQQMYYLHSQWPDPDTQGYVWYA
jgi:hypothetical protein